ncbi:D-aminoacyl-tRNA deacylase [Amaranthus tricolor]|uniref:D-aminoacyl-tRNA deacylase n=1 Tax=Amaranthus tricolor TaxID=29722 RepID=UPI00258F231B|nr:D-aminoacyl-tRNA deacylase [Amaranthus tricolor]
MVKKILCHCFSLAALCSKQTYKNPQFLSKSTFPLTAPVNNLPLYTQIHRRNQKPTIITDFQQHICRNLVLLPSKLSIKSISKRVTMVTLVVSTTIDPASIGPASALLAMTGWSSGPSFEGVRSYSNREVRLLQHDKSIVVEDNLDTRWEELTQENVDNVIFLSKHTAATNRPALTIHPIGVPHLKEGDILPHGGRAGWVAPPNPRMGPWIRLLSEISQSHNLIPEFEITMEATHHGPVTSKPTMFLEIGSTLEYWKREDAAQVIALLVWEGLGLGGGAAVGQWDRNCEKNKVLLGLGGGHYVPHHMKIIRKDNVWVGHLLSGYSLPMDDPGQSKVEDAKGIGGTWKEAIRVAFEATKIAFPGGEILAHLDHKSFKGWQKKAMTNYLEEMNIKIAKPNEFLE